MNLSVPELSLVVLVGPSGSGKSTFARQQFGPFEVVSSDFCRGLVSNDENDQSVSPRAFDLLYSVLHHRLALGRLTVVDATNLRPEDRRQLVQIAREYHVLPVAIVFDLPEKICQERNTLRSDRNFGSHVIRGQCIALHRHLRSLKIEGFRQIFTFKSVADVDSAIVSRQPLWNNKSQEHGPFDIIGDIHGCCDELIQLLSQLGYQIQADVDRPDGLGFVVTPPAGRKAIFLGDLVDRGPRIVDTLKLVMSMCADGTAFCVPGNHDVKLLKKLNGKSVQITHGLDLTLAELDLQPPEFHQQVAAFLDGLVSHYVLDDRKLVVAHAGLKAEMQGRGSGKVRDFCLYGETTGETDEFGLPIRYDWAMEYKGSAMVVYGHTPIPEPQWLNNTINIDTGCVFGGSLTALQYPEKKLITIPSARIYAQPAKPFLPADVPAPSLTDQQLVDNALDLSDVFGKLILNTRLQRNITIAAANSAAALEVMSRFAANPKWLIYLPPTMSPCETSARPDYLEYPEEALGYYRNQGIAQVICQKKHMGSRAVVILCRDESVARQRFGIVDEGIGILYTRTGRRFFDNPSTEQELLKILRQACESANLFQELSTDWICLDCELMPWSAKAQELLRQQYAAVGAAGQQSTLAAIQALDQTRQRLAIDLPLLDSMRTRHDALTQFIASYRNYCWPVQSLNDLRLAPFHLLASENAVHINQSHPWHMQWNKRLADAGQGIILATDHLLVDLTDPDSLSNGVNWWLNLTASGGEGMVVKPIDFIARGPKGLVQPAVKCRGREYLRIIYGPEYTAPAHIDRLRSRGLSRKRGLALREFSLGIESLERFVRREPLRRVHECVFGVLALESEPTDPRL